MVPLLLVGGGGHCRSAIDVIESCGNFLINGIVDNNLSGSMLGYPVLGGDDSLEKIFSNIKHAFVTVGQVKSPEIRIRIYERLLAVGYSLPTIIANSASFSKHAIVEQGSILMHGTVVVSGTKVGANVIINNHALIDHDCTIGDHCHISTGVKINGNVLVGKNCFIGSGAIVREGVHIGPDSFVAMGSVVTKSLGPNTIFNGKN